MRAPSNIVRNVFQQIRKSGRVRRGEIGLSTQTVTATLAEALQLSADAGVIVSDVHEGGPAARAGLQPGDIVLSLDGKRMENGRQFRHQHLHARDRPAGGGRDSARHAAADGAGAGSSPFAPERGDREVLPLFRSRPSGVPF